MSTPTPTCLATATFDIYNQGYNEETIAYINMRLEGTFGPCSFTGGFKFIHDPEDLSDGSDDHPDTPDHLRALLNGNGEYHRPYTMDFHDMIDVLKIKGELVEIGTHGSVLGGSRTIYTTLIRDPDHVILKAIRKSLKLAAHDLPSPHKEFVTSLLTKDDKSRCDS